MADFTWSHALPRWLASYVMCWVSRLLQNHISSTLLLVSVVVGQCRGQAVGEQDAQAMKRKLESVPGHLFEASARFRDGLRYTSGGPEAVSQKRGRVQFDALKKFAGLKPSMRFLEIGCGALELASFLVPYLEEDRYACVEPNAFLVHDALYARPDLLPEVLSKRAIFLRDSNFVGRRLLELKLPAFDIIYSHSVMSHAAWWQLPQYVRRTACFLADDGVSLASLMLGERDSMDDCWVYPGISRFRLSTIRRAAAQQNMTVTHVKEMRQYIQGHSEKETHDWIRFTNKGQGATNRSCVLDDKKEPDHQSTCTGVGTFYNPWFEVLPQTCQEEYTCNRLDTKTASPT
eukprot:TRINITY_DN51930_c0_g1_i1.p1 TRINITY_DN51930_c0_g1~~TRINITY_DN51930_c0_g1_i1.p1  ORF type:complete len:346 (-),score=59.30 TRINITY_DN51930_c0_g1_i1:330-1367(-)